MTRAGSHAQRVVSYGELRGRRNLTVERVRTVRNWLAARRVRAQADRRRAGQVAPLDPYARLANYEDQNALAGRRHGLTTRQARQYARMTLRYERANAGG